jgi:HD domain
MGKIEHAPEERDAVLLAAPGTPSRLLPAVVVATGLVSVLPGVLAAELLPSTELPSILASVLLAIALSAVAARLCATAWARRPGSHAVLFADLMAWSWLYRRVSAQRLEATRRRISDASAAGDAVPMATFVRLGRQLGARDVYTYGHSRRVARHAQNIARSMHLDRTEVERVRRAAAVHDIGKLHTPHGIVTKPGRLTDAEFAIVKRHPELVAMVRHHHERLDGRGYPDGLSGPVIPLGARIIAVADTFDALTSTRSYRPASTHKQALAVLAAEAGRQLDEDVVAAFLRHYSASRPAAAGAAITAGAHRLLSWLGSGAAGLSSGVASLAQVVPATGAVAALTLFPAASATGVQLPAAGGPAPAAAAVPAPTRDGSSTATPRPCRVRSGDVPTARMAPGATVGATRPRTEARRPAVSAPTGERAPSTAATGTAPQVPLPAAGRTPAAEVPAVTTPAVKTPAVTTPPVKVPAVTTPAVKTPAVEVPAVTTPAITTPAVKVPAVTTPVVKVPAIEVPPVSVGSVTTPSVSIPPVEIPSTPLPSRSAP